MKRFLCLLWMVVLIAFPVICQEKAEEAKMYLEDANTLFSWGNGNGVVESFEIVCIQGAIENLGQEEDLVLDLPQGIVLVHPIKIIQEATAKTKFSFSFMATESYKEKQLPIAVYRKDKSGMVMASYRFVTSFEKRDLSQKYLENTHRDKKEFDYMKKENLDVFLSQFPESEIAPIMLRLRLEYCRKHKNQIKDIAKGSQEILKAIGEYNEFACLYSNRLLAKVAVQECFELYQQFDTAEGYEEFIQLYPNTEQRYVAEQFRKAVHYREACQKNTIEAYDTFLQLHPEPSLFYLNCVKQAYNLTIQQEKEIRKTLKSKQEIEARVGIHLAKILEIQQEYKKYENVHERVRNLFLQSYQTKRIKGLLTECYRLDVPFQIFVIESLDEIKQLHIELKDFIQEENKKILSHIDSRFANIEKNMQANFDAIVSELQGIKGDIANLRREMQENFALVTKNLQILQQELKSMHQDIAARLDRIDNRLENMDQKLDTINESLKRINKSLVQALPRSWIPAILKGVVDLVVGVPETVGNVLYTGYQKVARFFSSSEKIETFEREVFYITHREKQENQYGKQIAQKATWGLATAKHDKTYTHTALEGSLKESLASLLEKSKKKEILLYIHGFSATFSDAIYDAGRIAHDLSFEGVAVTYSWPTQESYLYYLTDKENATTSATKFVSILEEIQSLKKEGKAEQIYLFAYSMGNYVLSNALNTAQTGQDNRLEKFQHIILSAPDVDADTFENTFAQAYKNLSQGTTIYVSAKDRALAVSKLVHKYPRAGEVEEKIGPYVVVQGLETIDVTVVESDNNHKPHRDIRILRDIQGAIQKIAPDKRGLQEEFKTGAGKYWKISQDMKPLRQEILTKNPLKLEVDKASIKIVLEGNKALYVGQKTNYSIKVINQGKNEIKNFTLKANLPEWLDYQGKTSVSWNLELAPGEDSTYTLEGMKPKKEGEASLEVLVEGKGHVWQKQSLELKSDSQSADKRYIVYPSGIIRDTKTNLEWLVGPDKNPNWDEAKAWVESISASQYGTGWRMPTRQELPTIYEKGKGRCNIDPVFVSPRGYVSVWSGELTGSSSAWVFYFRGGFVLWDDVCNRYAARVFAVRSGKQ